MKICWDNLEKLKLTSRGNFKNYSNRTVYYEVEACLTCGESFLTRTGYKGLYCSHECCPKTHTEKTIKLLREMKLGIKMSEETRKNMSNSRIGIEFTEEHKNNLSISHKNNIKIGKGGYYSKGVPMYDTFTPQLEPYEQCRRNADDPNILEVKCTYCGKWYIPKLTNALHRIQIINGNDRYLGESRFYCSNNCKSVCPIFGRSAQQLIKRDKIAAGLILPEELNREVQPQLRQMSFARDDYICVKCGSTGPLHCHHIDPVKLNPIESADVDNCITLCVDCHKEAHQLPGCGYGELRDC
jgi:5-methylcytosine-specific restriction endonuclease McrA